MLILELLVLDVTFGQSHTSSSPSPSLYAKLGRY